jgi:hypothetical protein
MLFGGAWQGQEILGDCGLRCWCGWGFLLLLFSFFFPVLIYFFGSLYWVYFRPLSPFS